MIGLAKRSADKPLTYGSVGIGSLYHLIVEHVQQLTGGKFTHVPYKGNAPVLQDLVAGQIDFAVLVYSSAMGSFADQGRLKVIGQLGTGRAELLKNVPTVSESKALKGFNYKIWTAFMVPKSTPELIMQRLHQAVGSALREPAVHSQLAGQTMLPSAPMSLEESAKYFEAETARYRAIAKAIGLQPQ